MNTDGLTDENLIRFVQEPAIKKAKTKQKKLSILPKW